MKVKNTPNPTKETFYYLLLLTGFFFLLEVSFFILSNKAYLADFHFVSSEIKIPDRIIPELLFFILMQLGVHFLFCISIWAIGYFWYKLFYWHAKQYFYFSLILWASFLINILLANQYYFPYSRFSSLTSLIFFTPTFTLILLLILTILNASILVIALLSFLKSSPKWFIITSAILFFSLNYFYFFIDKPPNRSAATAVRPNIIFIGVDSLRPDFLGFYSGEAATPFLNTYLKHSVVFSEAYTPLARTFPSWTSILMGEYPKQTGIRFDLADQTHMNFTPSLANILQQEGYETFYAIDDTRFSNINQSFGFDHLITPRVGLSDFLLGSFNDFPLSNLLVNFRISYYLFPNSYANRPAYVTYQPQTFLQFIQSRLIHIEQKPIFLTVHFCLAHLPYLWSDATYHKNILKSYQSSIEKMDSVLRDFFSLLRKNHLLDHAIVVLLSDHGEGLDLPGDRITEADSYFNLGQKPPKFYPESLEGEGINQSIGHGTDVLGLSQYHSLLVFRLYGVVKSQPKEYTQIVSLLDIKPTILELLGKKKPTSLFSQSLANYITDHEHTIPAQPIFLESDYSPQSIRSVHPEIRKVLLEGARLFKIDPHTGLLTMKSSMGAMIIQSKQLAVLNDGWILALYPQDKGARIPILVNLATGEWSDDLQSAFALQSPATKMLEDLRNFYGSEVGILKQTLETPQLKS